MMNSTVVYTCITGNYDRLNDPVVVSNGVDYVCFTDNKNVNSKIWKTRPIPNDLCNLTQVKRQRIVKICPHRYLPEYDVSVWVDGNIQILCDIWGEFLPTLDFTEHDVWTRRHPSRDCIYDEEIAVVALGKADISETRRQMVNYARERFPQHYGLCETNIMARKHNSKDCVDLMNLWSSQILNWSHRDQLSFNYCLWKLDYQIGLIDSIFNPSSNGDMFRLYRHSRRF